MSDGLPADIQALLDELAASERDAPALAPARRTSTRVGLLRLPDRSSRSGRFLRDNADLDLAHIRFVNPFIRGVRFSLATGLHVIAAHERRHLRQAWRARRAVTGEHAPASQLVASTRRD